MILLIKMKFLKDLKLYYNYLLILIGLGIVSWIIWARFIRPRVPKDIPLELTEKGFYILLYICIIYLYTVYKLIRPGQPNDIITSIVELLFAPLKALDEYIKNFKYVKPIYLKFSNKVITVIKLLDSELEHIVFIKKIYMRFYIIPRAILISILCMDIFYFNKLVWIYKVILLGVMPLSLKYLKYSVKCITDQYIKDLDSQYKYISLDDKNYCDPDWEYNPITMKYHDKEVSVEEYIRIQLELKELDNPMIGYDSWPVSQEHMYMQYSKDKYNDPDAELTEEDYTNLKSNFFKGVPIILNMIEFLRSYSEVDHIYMISRSMYILIKHVKIIIFGLYFICWSYILYKSYPTIPYPFIDTLCKLVITLPALEEPFSGDYCIYWDTL
jgi:hypothetical protein